MASVFILLLLECFTYQYLLCNLLKKLLNSFARLRTSLCHDHVVVFSYSLRLLELNPNKGGVKIALVPCESHYEAPCATCFCVLIHLIDPIVDGLEAFLIGYIVTYNCCSCVFIVELYHRSEFLAASSVPDMQLYLGHASSWGFEGYGLLKVGASDCHIVLIRENIFPEPLRYARLPNTCISQQHNLSLNGLALPPC